MVFRYESVPALQLQGQKWDGASVGSKGPLGLSLPLSSLSLSHTDAMPLPSHSHSFPVLHLQPELNRDVRQTILYGVIRVYSLVPPYEMVRVSAVETNGYLRATDQDVQGKYSTQASPSRTNQHDAYGTPHREPLNDHIPVALSTNVEPAQA